MSKKLNFNVIKKETDVYSKKVKAQLNEDYHIYYYPNFAPVKIQEMLVETFNDLEKAKENGVDADSINIIDWTYFHVIKHFCDLGIPDDLNLKLQAFVTIRNSEYFNMILKLFSDESMNKVIDAMDRMNENLKSMDVETLNKLSDISQSENNIQ